MIKKLKGSSILDQQSKTQLWNDISKALTHDRWYSKEELDELREVASKSSKLSLKQKSTVLVLKPHDDDDDNDY